MATPPGRIAAAALFPACGAASAIVLLLMLSAQPALSESPRSATPGVVTGGSQDVMVGGKPAARAGDTTTDGAIVEGSKNVFINGKPAAIGGSRTGCGGVVIGSGSGVFINGKPVARAGDSTANCK
ncbi:PAAR domain-containing protein [Rhodopseudomonas palustris]|uniref:PAAR domain-containing protein n=1 Tax=Rhodopseudomonas palustris TaxID=1076 RepID=UPI0022F0C14F|nr:PAAR domain-containing protein [Rhodopseudomonas palustris]WBU28070.1 PAAR domain-containing protein [Rhodopseudomonas palustris]